MPTLELGLTPEDAEFLSQQSHILNADVCAWLAQQWSAELQDFPWFQPYKDWSGLNDLVARDLAALFSGEFGAVLDRTKKQASRLAQQPGITHAEFFKGTDRLESLIRSFCLQVYTEADQQAVALAVIQKGIRSLEFIYIEEFRLHNERLINEKNEKTRVMFESLEEGVFLVNAQLEIEPVYSLYLDRIFQKPPQAFAQGNLWTTIVNHLNMNAETRHLALEVLGMTFDQESIAFEANRDNLFTRASWTAPSGDVRHLSFKWSALTDPKTDLVHKVMVVIRDETELVVLAEKARAQQQELEMIAQIIELSEARFQAYMQHFFQELERLRDLARDPRQNVFAVRRILHTLKGSSRTLGLNRLSSEIHELESLLEATAQPDVIPLDALTQVAADYQHVARVKLGRGTRSGDEDRAATLVAELERRVLARWDHLDPKHIRSEIASILNKAPDKSSVTLEELLDEEVRATQKLAQKLGKPPVAIRFTGETITIEPRLQIGLKAAFTHLLTNAVDHGLETASERQKLQKADEASIEIKSTITGGMLSITVQDDGRGLHLMAIRKKAEAAGVQGLESWSEHRLAQLILMQGLSTKDKVTSESGRGVGLDAVAEDAKAWGGTLSVQLLPRSARTLQEGFTAFQLELTLPEGCWSQRKASKAS